VAVSGKNAISRRAIGMLELKLEIRVVACGLRRNSRNSTKPTCASLRGRERS